MLCCLKSSTAKVFNCLVLKGSMKFWEMVMIQVKELLLAILLLKFQQQQKNCQLRVVWNIVVRLCPTLGI